MRRWSGRVVVLIVPLLALLAGSGSPACACSCQPSTDAEYAQRADLIFEGVAVDADKPLLPGTGTSITVTFVVEAVVKGAAGERVDVRTPDDPGTCGFRFDTGHRYRVYATGSQTTLCAGNRDLGAAPDVPLEDGWSRVLIAGAAVLAVGLVIWLARRSGRRRRRTF